MKTKQQNKSLEKELLDMYSTFGIDQDYDKLLEKILEAAVNYTNSDGGTLYIKENNLLHFKIVQTKSQGIFENLTMKNPKRLNYPPVPLNMQNACAYCALQGRIVNIDDVYSSDYDFTGPRNYDKLTGYKTTSMLIFPIENDFGEVIGVVQLINAMENGEVVPFQAYYNNILESFGVQAGICLRNMGYAQENLAQLYSFVEVLTTAIDELSKFNSNHTKNMVVYGENFLDWLEREDKKEQFSKNHREQFIMSMRLHDIGKLTTPAEILNKVNRLDSRMELVVGRIEKMLQANKLAYYEMKISDEESEEVDAELRLILNFVQKINKKPRLEAEEMEELKALKNRRFLSVNSREEALFTIEEYESLSAVRGNLTPEQWEKMQDHVSVTEKMLDKIKFSKDFKDVPFWASAHHELLNGKGYPHKLTADAIPIPVRLLTIIDSFEAMVASDRPYKKPKTPEEAVDILRFRVKNGELDGNLVELFWESKAWES